MKKRQGRMNVHYLSTFTLIPSLSPSLPPSHPPSIPPFPPHLVIPLEVLPELEDESLCQQLSDVRELGVDDGHQSSVDMSEGGGGSLRLED